MSGQFRFEIGMPVAAAPCEASNNFLDRRRREFAEKNSRRPREWKCVRQECSRRRFSDGQQCCFTFRGRPWARILLTRFEQLRGTFDLAKCVSKSRRLDHCLAGLVEQMVHTIENVQGREIVGLSAARGPFGVIKEAKKVCILPPLPGQLGCGRGDIAVGLERLCQSPAALFNVLMLRAQRVAWKMLGRIKRSRRRLACFLKYARLLDGRRPLLEFLKKVPQIARHPHALVFEQGARRSCELLVHSLQPRFEQLLLVDRISCIVWKASAGRSLV